ncbi:hypothetical protein LDENG_00275270, partial [Lucifuga dentata]
LGIHNTSSQTTCIFRFFRSFIILAFKRNKKLGLNVLYVSTGEYSPKRRPAFIKKFIRLHN